MVQVIMVVLSLYYQIPCIWWILLIINERILIDTCLPGIGSKAHWPHFLFELEMQSRTFMDPFIDGGGKFRMGFLNVQDILLHGRRLNSVQVHGHKQFLFKIVVVKLLVWKLQTFFYVIRVVLGVRTVCVSHFILYFIIYYKKI